MSAFIEESEHIIYLKNKITKEELSEEQKRKLLNEMITLQMNEHKKICLFYDQLEYLKGFLTLLSNHKHSKILNNLENVLLKNSTEKEELEELYDEYKKYRELISPTDLKQEYIEKYRDGENTNRYLSELQINVQRTKDHMNYFITGFSNHFNHFE
jgi:hypothetical protein